MKHIPKPISLLALLLVLPACGGQGSSSASSSSSSQVKPTCPVLVPTEGDHYVDRLPSSIDQGNILHCFDWSFKNIEDHLDRIAEAGFRVVQTSPVQQPKSSGAAWFYLYQPVSFAIAKSSPLGKKEELRSLCDAAEERGISVIVDIVANHMATTGQKDSDGFMVIDPEVEAYEPDIYRGRDHYFHRVKNLSGSGAVTMQYEGLPDLATEDEYIQGRVLSLLKECIDVGVDGFRFDAAKHIETSDESEDYPSNFWENTLDKAKAYYREKNQKDLLAYGEILNETGGDRDVNLYASRMKVTDNAHIDMGISTAVIASAHDASLAATALYGKNTAPGNLVTWAESHDTYLHEENHWDDNKIAREWAIVASRKDTQSLFFARPDEKVTVGVAASTFFEDERVASVNRFANRFLGKAEERHAENDTFYVCERYDDADQGAVVVDLALKGASTISFRHLPDGDYFDQITHSMVRIDNGKGCVSFEKGGIAVLTKTNNPARPTISVSQGSGDYFDPFDFTVTVNNATSATYAIDGGAKQSFTDSKTIKIGEGKTGGDKTTVDVEASNGAVTIKRSYVFTKIALVEGGFNVFHLNKDYLTNYDLFVWSWSGSNKGVYSNDYEYVDAKEVLLIHGLDNYTGMLLALFKKGEGPTSGSSEWLSPLKQSADIDVSKGYFDASAF